MSSASFLLFEAVQKRILLWGFVLRLWRIEERSFREFGVWVGIKYIIADISVLESLRRGGFGLALMDASMNVVAE